MTKDYDVIIIGAGVVGSMVARFLAKYKPEVFDSQSESPGNNPSSRLCAGSY